MIFPLNILPLNIDFGIKRLMLKKQNIHGIIKLLSDRWVTLISLLNGWVTYKHTFEWFGIKFTLVIDMNKCNTTKDSRWDICEQSSVRIEDNRTWQGVWKFNTLEGILLMIYAVVRTASPQTFRYICWKHERSCHI